MMFRNLLHSQRFGLVWFSLFLMAASFSQTAISQDEGFCYQIHLDGKDCSAFQYVSRNFLVFSDPSWTQATGGEALGDHVALSVFHPLKPGEELKISGDTLGQRVSFLVRRIGEAS